MEEVVVLLASEEIEILAPPAEIQLVVGTGATGQRGSKLWAGNGTPATYFVAINETALIGDMYLSIDLQRMYQLNETPTGAEWIALFDINELAGA